MSARALQGLVPARHPASLSGFCFDAFVHETPTPGEQRLLGSPWNPAPAAHLRSFWLMKPSCSFSTALARSGGEKGLRGSGAGTLGVPLGALKKDS